MYATRLLSRVHFRSTRSGRAAVAAGLAMAALVAATAVATPAHAVSSTAFCTQVIVIGVRGTNEAAGFGGRLNFTASVVTQTPLTARRVALGYPATAVSPIYSLSQNTGVINLKALVTQLSSQCGPNTRFVLAGYSQGAHVVGDVLASDSPYRLAATYRNRIAAVIFFGDPTYRLGQPYNYGTGVVNGTWPKPAGVLSEFNSRLRAYCYQGDAWCQNNPLGDTADVHGTKYQTTTVQANALAFVLARL
jgi:hypothetical protein